ncbi:MAG: hypothetical protein NTU60_06105 [Candidatus Aminicenantes bacterium]|nr:hypothetical protein [Candidatus Aminicenantes bacterium]
MDVEAGVRPRKQPLCPFRAEKLPVDERGQHLTGEDLGEPRVVDPRDLMEGTPLVHAALGHQVMERGVEINPVPKGLDGGDDPGRKRVPGHNLEVTAQGPEDSAAKIAEETAIELKEDPQPLGDGEDDLAMRHIQEKLLPHPFPPFLDPLGMTRWAESPDMLCTAYPGICGANEYAEYQGVAEGELAAFQGVAVLTGAICFAYSSQSDNLLGDVQTEVRAAPPARCSTPQSLGIDS